jgi:hypothetical protein
MRWPDPKARLFPRKPKGEPESLRNDIVDELADHLALAAESEREREDSDETTVWRRVRDRFGDPDAVARQLWWQAMKETVMREWIQTGVMVLTALLLVALAGLMVQTMRQMQGMQQAQVTLIEAVKNLQGREGGSGEGMALNITVRRGSETGPPAPGVLVTLTNELSEDNTATVSLESDDTGQVVFRPLPQGNFPLRFDDPVSGYMLELEHSLFGGVGSKLMIVAPDSEGIDVPFNIAPALPFSPDHVGILASYGTTTTVAGRTWEASGEVMVTGSGVARVAFERYLTPRRSSQTFLGRRLASPLNLQRALRLPGYAVEFSNSRIIYHLPEIPSPNGDYWFRSSEDWIPDLTLTWAPRDRAEVTVQVPEVAQTMVQQTLRRYAACRAGAGVRPYVFSGDEDDVPEFYGTYSPLEVQALEDLPVLIDLGDDRYLPLEYASEAGAVMTVDDKGRLRPPNGTDPQTLGFEDMDDLMAAPRVAYVSRASLKALSRTWPEGVRFFLQTLSAPRTSQSVRPVRDGQVGTDGTVTYSVAEACAVSPFQEERHSTRFHDITDCVREAGFEAVSGFLIHSNERGIVVRPDQPHMQYELPHLVVASESLPPDLLAANP